MLGVPMLACCLLAFAPSLPAVQETDALPGDPFERLAEPLRRTLAALDPLTVGWSSEARADAASAQLKRLAHVLESGSADDPGSLFAEGFRALHAARDATTVFENPAFRVRRLASNGAEPLDAAGFLASLEHALSGAQDVHVKFKIIHVEERADGLVTQAILLASARGPSGPLQRNALWECRWKELEEGAPLLAGLDVLEDERIEAPDPILRDRSEVVLGREAAWSEQLVPGLSAWRARLDTRLGVPLLGHAAGLAVGDVDGDGLEDLYVCQPGGMPNRLFLHRPDGTAVDRSAESGVDFMDFSRSALLLDLDGDGDRDLVVSAAERLLVMANDGHGRFWLQAALAAPDATSLAAADIDLDGDLDLYVCAYASPYDHSALPVPYHDARNGKPNTLFVNQGDWIFTDETEERGLDQNNRRFSFAASFEDYDLDGDPDLYVANDFGRNNLYRNERGRFTDVAAAAGVEDISAGMGVAWGDYDGDGRFDLYVSNMYSSAGNRIAYQRRFQAAADDEVRAQYQRHAHGNTLFHNQGDGTFVDATGSSALGVAMGRWAWGALFDDLDGDGWQDLLSPNGFLTEELSDDL